MQTRKRSNASPDVIASRERLRATFRSVSTPPTISICARTSPSTVPSTWMSPLDLTLPMMVRSEERTDGAGFAGFAAGHIGQAPHSPDLVAIPDFSSLTVLPWRKNIAWVASNAFVDRYLLSARAPAAVRGLLQGQ